MPVTDQSSLNPHKSITPDVDLMLDFVFQGGGVDYKKTGVIIVLLLRHC
ncbi:unnamed protein product [Brassica rapa subsp. trilocularis]